MVKAACNIPRPDGKTIKKGDELPSELIDEFERCSPHLLDCYVTINSVYYKKIGKSLVSHEEVLKPNLVEKGKKANATKKEEDKPKEKPIEEMTKKQLEKYAREKGIDLDRRKSLENMIKDFKKKVR